LKRSLC